MTIDRVLGLLGIVIGLPGFILLFFNDLQTIGILCITIGLLIIVIGIIYYFYTRPSLYLEEVKKELTFKSENPQIAILEHTVRGKTNRLITQYQVDGISADGEITNILIDNMQPDIERLLAGQYVITKNFPNGLPSGSEIYLIIRYEYLNSFPNNQEGLIHQVLEPTKQLNIIINLLSNKPAINCKATLKKPDKTSKNLERPLCSNNGTKIEFRASNLKVGEQYWIEWSW